MGKYDNKYYIITNHAGDNYPDIVSGSADIDFTYFSKSVDDSISNSTLQFKFTGAFPKNTEIANMLVLNG